jgi:hypothetical protein
MGTAVRPPVPPRRLARERGVNFIGVAILLAIAAGFYWIVVFGAVHWENHELKAVIGQACNIAYQEIDDRRVRQFIMTRADEMFGYEYEEFGMRKHAMKIQFEPDDLILERSKIPPEMRIRLSYTRTVKLPIIGGERVVAFAIDVRQDLSPVKY